MLNLPFLCQTANAQAIHPMITKSIGDWQKRFDRVRAVRYTIQGQHLIPKHSLAGILGPTEVLPANEITCSIRRIMLLDLTGNRHRLEVDDEVYSYAKKATVRRKSTGVFDGREFRGVHEQIPPIPVPNSPPDPDATFATGNLKYAAFEGIHWPMLFGHGIVRILGGPEILPSALRQNYDPEMLVFHGQSVEEGRTCTVLRSRTIKGGAVTFVEIATDPGRDSAIVRYLETTNGKPFSNSTIRYRETPLGWLPASWTTSLFGGGRLLFSEKLSVTNLELNPSVADSDFDIQLKPGMLLKKVHYGDPMSNLVPLPTTTEEYYRVSERGRQDRVVFEGGHEQSSASKPWPYVVAAAGLLASTIVLIGKYRKRLVARNQPG